MNLNRILSAPKSAALASLLIAAVALSFGCSRKTPDGMPKLVDCQVTVTQGNAPLADATVSFSADDMKWSISGTTDASGVAKIYTHGDYPGCPEGTFKVTVSKTVVEDNAEEITSASQMITSVAYECVDKQYSSRETTPLTITVSGKTSETFDVGEAVHEAIKAL